jgi:hypothetical protein
MKTALNFSVAVVVAVLLTITAFADTLVLKDGTEIVGYYEGGTSRVIRFQTSDGVQEYDLLAVSELRFGGDAVPSAPVIQTPPPVEARAVDTPPRLQTPAESAQPVVSSAAIGTAFTVPRGSSLLVRLVDDIDSEEDQAGQVFRATLAEPLLVDNIEVAPIDSTIRGRIVNAEQAGRVRGAAELRLELTQIVVNGITYAIATSEYGEAAEDRSGESARRVGAGAGVGALIGLIAGGGKGAAIGAGVGAGTAGAVQVLTSGEKLYIPAETLLDFTLSESLSIAAK